MIDGRAVGVARRAAELALAQGLDLPEDLALWRLAGGRPSDVAPAPGRPEELGERLEAAFSPSDRRRTGAHYTPAPLAAELVARALAGHSRPAIGDPACGGGALLLAAGRHLAARGEAPQDVLGRLWGADVDAVAVGTTEVALWLWAGARPAEGHLVVADALAEELSWPPLDAVVGNPPFLSQLAMATARPAMTSARLRERFGGAVQAYTDTASLFLLAACRLAAPGGTVALLQPQSVLGARDAAGLREAVGDLGRVTDVWIPPAPAFADAAVEVCVLVVEIGRPEPGAGWTAHLSRAQAVPPVELEGSRRLGDEATTTAAFRSEYYGMVDHVHEQPDCEAGVPLITTGLVDLGGCGWGARPARMGGRSWSRPVLDVGALEGRAAVWAGRTHVPKLIVATQTRVVEVVADEPGAWIPGVPLVVVLAPVERLWALAAALASPAVTAWALHRTAGTALSSRALKVTAALLRQVPLPADQAAWAAGTQAFQDRDLAGFAEAMTAAYASSAEVADWWGARAATVWSPGGEGR